MTHWGWYWKRIGHKPKSLCSSYSCLDSFKVFKNKDLESLKFSNSKFSAELVLEGDHFIVTVGDLKYKIPVEKQPCQFGGYRYFLRCPGKTCNGRMRKLYCCGGVFLCRKCLNLGYYSQRVVPSTRFWLMQNKLEEKLKKAGGNLWKKPKGMHKRTFEKINKRHFDYEWKGEDALHKEIFKYFGGGYP